MAKIKQAFHNNLTCSFTEKNHQYKIEETGQILISATTLIKRFFPTFDAQAIAEKTGEKRGRKPKDLLKEWAAKGAKASLEGNYAHNYLENEFIKPGSGKELKANPPTKRSSQLLISADIAKNQIQKKYKNFKTEMLIFSPVMGVAGQIDLLAFDKTNKKIALIDWKTNKKLTTTNDFQKGLGPLNDLEDANLIHYSLQLSLYQYILTFENYFPGVKEFKRIIVHLKKEQPQPYLCPDLTTKIESMII